MKSGRRANWAALAGALSIFLLMVLLLKLRNWMPLVVGLVTYLVLLSVFWPRRRRRRVPLPDGIDGEEFKLAMERLSIGAKRLRREIADAPMGDRSLINDMADLIDRIRDHHEANPGHFALTRQFIRHALSRMIEAVIDYVALHRRAGPEQQPRMDEIAAELRDFVPALEKVDRACLENDLDALQISVEVLNDQLDRKRH